MSQSGASTMCHFNHGTIKWPFNAIYPAQKKRIYIFAGTELKQIAENNFKRTHQQKQRFLDVFNWKNRIIECQELHNKLEQPTFSLVLRYSLHLKQAIFDGVNERILNNSFHRRRWKLERLLHKHLGSFLSKRFENAAVSLNFSFQWKPF